MTVPFCLSARMDSVRRKRRERMPRPLFLQEIALLTFLIETCEPIYGDRINQWKAQIRQCLVREIGSRFYLAMCHDDSMEKAGCDVLTLTRELVGVDHGVPVLIYAVAMKTPTDLVIDAFNVDRLDGEPLVDYPEPGAGLMIIEEGRRVGGADLRHLVRLPG
ncbi:hypothetical protein [Paraburkholderia bryophila]|uniref:hypothetical protein n=1 Tax=Paraburkholderia bryophila TaxID=420952 RepID=UPI0011BD6F30|nr:hypothetical protein [Paraburkholderia bryophila]